MRVLLDRGDCHVWTASSGIPHARNLKDYERITPNFKSEPKLGGTISYANLMKIWGNIRGFLSSIARLPPFPILSHTSRDHHLSQLISRSLLLRVWLWLPRHLRAPANMSWAHKENASLANTFDCNLPSWPGDCRGQIKIYHCQR